MTHKRHARLRISAPQTETFPHFADRDFLLSCRKLKAWGEDATTRFHQSDWRRRGRTAVCSKRTTAGHAGDRIPRHRIAITATFRETRSASSAGNRSYRPSAQRYSKATLRPSKKPVSRKPCKNAGKRTAFKSSALGLTVPISLLGRADEVIE
jgi:hypothetical protein